MSEAVTRSAVERLIDTLNEKTSVRFDRDAWVDEAGNLGGDYGVVEITGSPVSLWGDNQMIEQMIAGNVVIYVFDGSDSVAESVQNVLRDTENLSFSLRSREFLDDPTCVRWTWSFRMEEFF